MTFKKNGAVFYGEMAKSLQSISDSDWAFYKYRDGLFEEICSVMERNEIKRTDLAKMLGKSRSFVTQLFSGSSNITLKTLCEILYVLDVRPETRLVSKDVDVMWVAHCVDRHQVAKSSAKKKALSAFSNFQSVFVNTSIAEQEKDSLYCIKEGAA